MSSYYTCGCDLLQLPDTDENQPREERHGAEVRKIPDMELPTVLLRIHTAHVADLKSPAPADIEWMPHGPKPPS